MRQVSLPPCPTPSRDTVPTRAAAHYDGQARLEDEIRGNAELVQEIAIHELGVPVSFDLAGVRWLDAYINQQDPALVGLKKYKLIQNLGAFLGECIRCTYGGEWVEDSGYWAVRFSEGNAVFPFNKVHKQLENGSADSVLSLFTCIAVLYSQDRALVHPLLAQETQPWWAFWRIGHEL